MQLTAACAFGLEALVKRELIALGFDGVAVSQPGRVGFHGDWSAVCRANIWLRTADRVLIEVQRFAAPDFDALFETVKAFDWGQLIPRDGAFPVIGRSRLSQLTSVPAVQRTVKKALVESLQRGHGANELSETGSTFKVEIALLNDEATLTIDTTGASLHKRGYRKLVGEAPLKETLAAAMVSLSVWNPDRPLVDPFCGSGTIPIEAALIGLNIAPGISREFAASTWPEIASTAWQQAIEEAQDLRRKNVELQIIGTDRDEEVLSLARYHSKLAGVPEQIHFQQKPFHELRSKRDYGCIITNPPYGERLEDHQRLIGLYESIPGVMQRLPTWSLFLITNMPRFESLLQKEATRRRKLFNGRLECTYYQYLGPRPPRARSAATATSPDTDQQSQRNQGNDECERSPAAVDLANSSAGERTSNEQLPDVNPEAAPPKTSIPMVVVNQQEPVEQLVESEDERQDQQPDKQPDDRAPGVASQSMNDVDNPSKARISESLANEHSTKLVKQLRTPTTAPLFGGLTDKDREQADLLKRRLIKRAKHLRRWPTKRGITCYRLYERDIPEIPLVIDRYEDFVHLTEYERPHERDLARHAAWLELMTQATANALDLPIGHAFLKKRRKHNDTRQYEKIDSIGKLIEVQEAGLKFLVNLSDYVDTGLFLDHRNTRQMVREEASGKDFLNLFAYTGSFSVYAAAGGATSTTTVDLSKNYLSWAAKNMAANGYHGTKYQFIPSDSIEFLQMAVDQPRQRFDLAVVDPPTFSNSKRTERDWDVQTRHVELLRSVGAVMRPGGVIYFSTNFRRFKFAQEELERSFDCREISKQSVPEDFRNRRIHRCWRIVLR